MAWDIKGALGKTWEKTQKVGGHVIDSTTGAIKTGVKETGKFLEKGLDELKKTGVLDKLGNLGKKMLHSISGSVGHELKGMSTEDLTKIALRTAAGDPTAIAGIVANVAIGAIEDGTGQKVPGDVKKVLSGKVLESASEEVLKRLEKETGVKLPKGTLKAVTQAAKGNYMGAVMEGTKVLPEGVSGAVKAIQNLKGGHFSAKDLKDNLTKEQVEAIQKRLGLKIDGDPGPGTLKAVKGFINKLEDKGVDIKGMDIKDLPELAKEHAGLKGVFKPAVDAAKDHAVTAAKDAGQDVKNEATSGVKSFFKQAFDF